MNSKKLSNPDAKFFKESFGRTDIAISGIKEYLPSNFHKKLNYGS